MSYATQSASRSTMNADKAVMLTAGGTQWGVANGNALALTDPSALLAVDPQAVIDGVAAQHAHVVPIRLTDHTGLLRSIYLRMCVAWASTASGVTLATTPRVAVLGRLDAPNPSSVVLPHQVNGAWPNIGSPSLGGRGNWDRLPDLEGTSDVDLAGDIAVAGSYMSGETPMFFRLGRPVDVALRGATDAQIHIVRAGALSGAGTAMVLYRLWS
ncbi:MAG TPA: hypothetical protein PKC43_06230 [Phycisphaerales bacterium]|nr:hypothetical protein [Phycisphaerales bacterium]HMP37029.1 hypothetical protein [Phycisphaerales bacterium]